MTSPELWVKSSIFAELSTYLFFNGNPAFVDPVGKLGGPKLVIDVIVYTINYLQHLFPVH